MDKDINKGGIAKFGLQSYKLTLYNMSPRKLAVVNLSDGSLGIYCNQMELKSNAVCHIYSLCNIILSTVPQFMAPLTAVSNWLQFALKPPSPLPPRCIISSMTRSLPQRKGETMASSRWVTGIRRLHPQDKPLSSRGLQVLCIMSTNTREGACIRQGSHGSGGRADVIKVCPFSRFLFVFCTLVSQNVGQENKFIFMQGKFKRRR